MYFLLDSIFCVPLYSCRISERYFRGITKIYLYLIISLEHIEVIRLETMPVNFKLSCKLVGKSLKVTIPRELVEHLTLKKGDTVVMWV